MEKNSREHRGLDTIFKEIDTWGEERTTELTERERKIEEAFKKLSGYFLPKEHVQLRALLKWHLKKGRLKLRGFPGVSLPECLEFLERLKQKNTNNRGEPGRPNGPDYISFDYFLQFLQGDEAGNNSGLHAVDSANLGYRYHSVRKGPKKRR
ncbi:MAG: hypothetical protein WC862_02310 [Patescibacteria group bacterium]